MTGRLKPINEKDESTMIVEEGNHGAGRDVQSCGRSKMKGDMQK